MTFLDRFLDQLAEGMDLAFDAATFLVIGTAIVVLLFLHHELQP